MQLTKYVILFENWYNIQDWHSAIVIGAYKTHLGSLALLNQGMKSNFAYIWKPD
jgi:hypothetical protein